MQAAKKAVESIKETAANIGASAKSGLEKTKAAVQEKTGRMSANDPVEKDIATEKKEERINQADMEKQEAREHNAAVKESATGGPVTEGHYTAAAAGPGAETATHHPIAGEHGLGQPAGANHVPGPGLAHELLTEDVMGSHPTGTNTGMGSTAARDVHVVGGTGPRIEPSLN